MSKVIHRFPLKLVGDTILEVSDYCRHLSVTLHNSGMPNAYFVVEGDEPKTRTVHIRGVMTGEYTDEQLGTFLGTVHLPSGFVVHYFVTYDSN